MTREEAIAWCDRFNNAWANADQKDDFPDLKYSDTLDQLFYLAGQALRQQECVGEANKALTLDELRKMEGQPVWMHTFSAVQKKTNVAQWAILETVGSANATFLRAGVNSRLTKWFCNYGERWLAYRRNPEDGEK